MNFWQRLLSHFNKKTKVDKVQVVKPAHPKSEFATKTALKSKSSQVKPNNKIKYIIAIASGKGGVGKSTVTSNLAFALESDGHKVGLLDADIYGPSQAVMLGNGQKATAKDGLLIPIESNGIKFISMSSVNPKAGAVIVRAPIAVQAVNQFLTGVQWGELDYLLIDLPPGTGDIQLSLAQKAKLSGVIIVTTPQPLAVEIARKSLQMFKKVNVPILGVIENMSGYTCQHCHKKSEIFNEGGGEIMAETDNIKLLAQIPLDSDVLMHSGSGRSIISELPESLASQAFKSAALELDNNLKAQSNNVNSSLEPHKIINNKDLNQLELIWADGKQLQISPYKLRCLCICAACRDEITGKAILNVELISIELTILDVKNVGRYGLGIRFSDQHATGIYRFEVLKEMAT